MKLKQGAALVVLALGCAVQAARAQDAPQAAPDNGSSVGARVHGAIVRGAQAAGRGIEKGARAAEHGVRVGVQAAARGIERGAQATARAAQNVAKKVESASDAKPASSATP